MLELLTKEEGLEVSEGLEQSISFPYQTIKRTVIFGGHHTFLKEIRRKDYAFNMDIIRNADVVWVQTNCISHTQYARILKTVRTYGTQLCYFSCASARKCAEQIVEEDRKSSQHY